MVDLSPDPIRRVSGILSLSQSVGSRTVAHEIIHYLLNNFSGDNDDRGDDDNLMFKDAVQYKRDLDEAQCLEVRSDYGVD